MAWDRDKILRTLQSLLQGLFAFSLLVSNRMLLKRSYFNFDFMFLAGCSVVFAMRALDKFKIFDLMVPCMYCTALLPFCIQMHNLDAVGKITMAVVTLVFILQFRSQTLPNVNKYEGIENSAFLYIEVNLNIAWITIPMVCAVQCIFMIVFGDLGIFKCWWIEVLLFQGTFFMFTYSFVKFMAMEQTSAVETGRPTDSQSERPVVNTNDDCFQEQTGQTPQNFRDYEHRATPRQVSSKDLIGKQSVINHNCVWWAFWPMFVGIFCLVMLCVYQHRGSFGYFSAFSCDLALSFLVLFAFYIAVNHATKFWRLNEEKTATLYLMIATVIIMVGDIDVTPGVPFTMPELLITWYCFLTGNFVQVALWAIAKFKTILNARKTDADDPGVEKTTSTWCGVKELIWTWIWKFLLKQIQMSALDFLKNLLYSFVLSIICKKDAFEHLVCSTIV